MWYENIAGRFFGLVTKHACDRRTDRQNYDSQDSASIASGGKNCTEFYRSHSLSTSWSNFTVTFHVNLDQPDPPWIPSSARSGGDSLGTNGTVLQAGCPPCHPTNSVKTTVKRQLKALAHPGDNHPRTGPSWEKSPTGACPL